MLCYFAHCDGLVLIPTDTKLYLFNPATSDAVTLPKSSNDNLQHDGVYHSAAGLGLDPRTGKYKVVRSFYRCSWDDDPLASIDRVGMGMEVFTVGGGGWREILPNPPYPVERWQTARAVNGFMFWHMNKVRDRHEQPPRGLLSLSLEDEAFAVIGLPDSLDPALDDTFMLDVLHGELWLSAHTSEMPSPRTMTIWALCVEESRWKRRYSICVSDVCHPMGLAPFDGMVLWSGFTLYRYDLPSSELTIECDMDGLRYQGRRARTWKNLFAFNVKPYTESLVPITL